MPPATLFRYYPATLLTLENIKAQSLFFGGVRSFNDPFECSVARADTRSNPSAVATLRRRYSSAPEIPAIIRNTVGSMPVDEFEELVTRSALECVQTAKTDFIAGRGVVCFSERNENLLMWSHYASGGSGVCLEFRTANDLFKSAFQVRYAKEPPILDALQVMASSFDGTGPVWIEDLYCTKPEDWCYEKEWRVIHQKQGTLYTYPREALKAVYFGPRSDRRFMEIVCLTLLGQHPDVEFWRGSICHTEYKVVFERFSYCSSEEARKQAGE